MFSSVSNFLRSSVSCSERSIRAARSIESKAYRSISLRCWAEMVCIRFWIVAARFLFASDWVSLSVMMERSADNFLTSDMIRSSRLSIGM